MNPNPIPMPRDVLRRAQAASALHRTSLSRRAVLNAVGAHDGIQAATIADTTGRSRTTVNRLLSALLADGLVTVDRDPYDFRTRRYSIVPETACTCLSVPGFTSDPWCPVHRTRTA